MAHTDIDVLSRDTQTLLQPVLARMEASIARGAFVDMDVELDGLCPPGVPNDVAYLLDDVARRQGVGATVWERLGFVDRFFLRQHVVDAFGFALPGPGTAFPDAVRPFGPVLEIGAGLGTLGRLLRAAGVDCISTDAKPWKRDTEVEAMDAEAALSAYPGRTVLCAWPDYQSGWLTDLLARFAPGQHLLLVGEGPGGCTGDDALFEVLAGWTRKPMPRNAIWRWEGVHDHLGHWVAP
jgi:hypothetical protein